MKKIILFIIVILLLILAVSCIKITPVGKQPMDHTLTLSVYMTKQEIINLLGDNYSLTTEKDLTSGEYYSTLSYEDLYFGFSHKEETCPEDINPSTIITGSSKYTFSHGFTVGSNTIEALSKCEELYSKTLNEQSKTYFFDIFDYKESNDKQELVKTSYKIRFEYTDDKYYESKEVIDKESCIELIHIFSMTQ